MFVAHAPLKRNNPNAHNVDKGCALVPCGGAVEVEEATVGSAATGVAK